jgi:hypothetical protein
MAEFPKNWLKV